MANSAIPELNPPEQLLKLLSTFNSLVEGVFSSDLNAELVADDPQALHAGILGDLASQAGRAPEDLNIVLQYLRTSAQSGLCDDKNYLQEKIVQLAASLPSDSKTASVVTQQFIDVLWNNLQHPPLSYLGDEWKYRTADGSNNNTTMPQLGKAGSSYARTVAPKTLLPPTLPDPGLVFDELMAREGKPKEHPNKISSMLFYLATIIIHDIFRTDSRDWNKVDNSSYLDLSPLYGNSDETQATVRTFKDGMLKPDAFYETRLLGFPPGVAALLISFNRFHNYVATELATIDEGGRFTLLDPRRLSPADVARYGTPERKRDNDLFQTARLVTCGLYVNIILIDYVKTILNLNTTHSNWILDPRANPADKYGPTGIPQGVGNQVSVEFNLVYRWHSAISEKDEQWSKDFFAEQFPGMDPSKLTPEELGMKFFLFLNGLEKTDPGQRTFAGLSRTESGAFKDQDLIDLLTDSTEDVAAAFGARQVPVVMRAIEMMGIKQARHWNVATLNEFRSFFGMQPHKEFSDISSDPDVARSLESLYGHPDKVELYPGLVSEDAKEPVMPGSGLCPGFTVSKAILADAVALVRGDRFYTVDYNAATLTNWGWTQIQSNPAVAQGGVFYILLHRAFPSWYSGGSVYAMFPLTHPDKTREILTELGTVDQYEFSRPTFTAQPPQIKTWKAVTKILSDQATFTVPWGAHTTDMTHHDYMLSGDTKANAAQHAFVEKALYPARGTEEIAALYERTTMDLLRERSRKMRKGYQIDAVADLANLSHAIAVGKMFNVPLKLPGHVIGVLTPVQFYTIMSLLFAYVFLDVDDGAAFALRAGALQSAAVLGKIIEFVSWHVEHDPMQGLRAWFASAAHMSSASDDPIPNYGAKLIRRLFEGGKSVTEVTWTVVPTIAAAVATQAQGLSQALDLLLGDGYYHHWADTIIPLAKADDDEGLQKVALECLRLATPAFGVLRNVETPHIDIQDGDATVHLKYGEQVFTNFVACGVDPEVYPDPLEIKLDRDPSLYIHHGWGQHACIGRGIVTTALATQLKCLARLKNLRRVPGGQGEMKHKTVQDAFKVYMKPDWSNYWPFPTTMKVMYDEIEDW